MEQLINLPYLINTRVSLRAMVKDHPIEHIKNWVAFESESTGLLTFTVTDEQWKQLIPFYIGDTSYWYIIAVLNLRFDATTNRLLKLQSSPFITIEPTAEQAQKYIKERLKNEIRTN